MARVRSEVACPRTFSRGVPHPAVMWEVLNVVWGESLHAMGMWPVDSRFRGAHLSKVSSGSKENGLLPERKVSTWPGVLCGRSGARGKRNVDGAGGKSSGLGPPRRGEEEL